jgi:flagellar biosynthetic protein FliO
MASESALSEARPALESTAPNDAIATWLVENVSPTQNDRRLLRRNRPAGPGPSPERTRAADLAGTGALRLLWPLALVLALIVAAALAWRKWSPRSKRFGAGGVINVLASHYLSPKQSLCLVRLGRRMLLIGVTPERISTVAEIQQPQEASEILAAIERARPSSFTSVFTRLSKGEPVENATAEPIEEQAAIADRQLARTGTAVRDLISRVRGLRCDLTTSAEPT